MSKHKSSTKASPGNPNPVPGPAAPEREERAAPPPTPAQSPDGVHAISGRPRKRSLSKVIGPVVVLLALLLGDRVASACFSCANPSQWSEREQLCRTPSEGLWLDAIECMCEGPCSTVCSTWCAEYDACEATQGPTCWPGDAGPACDACVEGNAPFEGRLGCEGAVSACSADRTGCVTCNAWLGGGDPHNLCPGPNGPDAFPPAIALSDCGCSACAASCSSACTLGHLDTTVASFACGTCLGGACAAELSACQAS